MGDAADMVLESIDYSIYNGYWEGDDDRETSFHNLKKCRCCGRDNLFWKKRNNKWRLFDRRGIHVCSVNPLKELNVEK